MALNPSDSSNLEQLALKGLMSWTSVLRSFISCVPPIRHVVTGGNSPVLSPDLYTDVTAAPSLSVGLGALT